VRAVMASNAGVRSVRVTRNLLMMNPRMSSRSRAR